MKFEDHCQRSQKLFGKRYEEIHQWLDEFASQYSYSDRYKHRKHRHHYEGVEKVKEKFGNLEALVAEDHIRIDNKGILPKKRDYELPEYDD